MVWRSVQEERPRTSTSGGQSGGGWRGRDEEEEEEWELEEVSFLVIAAQAAKEVQERHLNNFFSIPETF